MKKGQKILVADTDDRLSRIVADSLLRDQFTVKGISGNHDTSLVIQQFQPDLLILDPALSHADGFQIIRDIRLSFRNPIIVTSSRADIFSKVLAFEMGADDYLQKPYDIRELTARVKALLRRAFMSEEDLSSRASARTIEYPGLIIDPDNHTVDYNGKRMQMSPKEFELLFFLAQAPNQVFTRKQLLNYIWGYDYLGDSRTVDVHIKRLRKKLHDNENWALTTVWGVGYKFTVSGGP